MNTINNNIVTYSDLKCPSVNLKCILEDLFCGLVNNPECLDFQMALSPSPNNILTVTVGGVTKQVNLSPYLDDVDAATLISSDSGNDITIGADGKLKLVEEITTVDSLAVVSGNVELKYTNETNTQQTVTMPVSSICAECGSCFEVGNTVSYTIATRPATGSPGQIIYVSDAVASDASIGSLFTWQVSSNSWKRILVD